MTTTADGNEKRRNSSIQDSRSEHARRMYRVLEHIDQHLSESLELDELATVANFSPYHFHRLFAAWMGETLGQYLRRRRLEIAARNLIGHPHMSVLRIALSVGFGSSEAFARAFKTHFGESPTAWRRRMRANRNPDQALRNRDQEHGFREPYSEVSHTRSKETSMHVRLIDRPPTTVACMRNVGPYGEPILGFWQNVVAPWMATNNLFGRPRYGISHDDPAITSPEKCRYDACVEVAADFAGSGTYRMSTIPGGRYASMPFKGTVTEIVTAWDALLRDWLPGSNLQIDARPLLEYYDLDSTFDPTTGVFSCDLCIPVSPL